VGDFGGLEGGSRSLLCVQRERLVKDLSFLDVWASQRLLTRVDEKAACLSPSAAMKMLGRCWRRVESFERWRMFLGDSELVRA